MITKTANIVQTLDKLGATKARDISNELGIDPKTVTGILSYLKRAGKCDNHKMLWNTTRNVTNNIKSRLIDIGADNQTWCEGYISALADSEIINENQFDELLDWIKAL